MLKNIKAAIFDLDGTLVDSMGIWSDIDVEYLKRYNLDVPANLQQEVEGLAFTEVAVYFKEHFHIQESIEEIKNQWNEMAMEKYLHQVPLKPGVKDFLTFLKKNNILTGVASSNSSQLVKAALDGHNIREYFDCILTCCEVSKGKPAPDVYLEVARRLRVSPSDCIVFEDIPLGLQAGISAGMRTCAVWDSYSVRYNQEKHEMADYYIDDYNWIIDHVLED